MSWRILSYDAFSGVETWWQWDALENRNVIKYRHRDVEPHLDHAASLRNDTDYTRQGMKGDNALHYAHIPDSLLLEWRAMGVDINDTKALFEMVNRPEYKRFKTTEAFHA